MPDTVSWVLVICVLVLSGAVGAAVCAMAIRRAHRRAGWRGVAWLAVGLAAIPMLLFGLYVLIGYRSSSSYLASPRQCRGGGESITYCRSPVSG